MYTFETPEAIAVSVELCVGDIRVVASERADTVVEVRPSNSGKKSDVNAARQTRVELTGGRLLIRAPKGWRQHTFWGGSESVDVQIDLPAGSQLQGDAAVATLDCSGRLAECSFTTSAGDIRIAEAGAVRLKTSVGGITVKQANGDAELTTSSGALRIDRIAGTGVIRNSNGDTWVGDVTGDLRASAANGSIRIDHARSTVAAKTANGDIRLHDIGSGAVLAETARGRIEIGVREGVAAWLDLRTQFGRVTNNLDDAAQPEPGDDTVEVRARTSFGDITVGRARAHDDAKDHA